MCTPNLHNTPVRVVVSEGSEGSIHSEWQRSRSDVANLELMVVSGFRVMNKSDHVDSYISWSFSGISEHVVSMWVSRHVSEHVVSTWVSRHVGRSRK